MSGRPTAAIAILAALLLAAAALLAVELGLGATGYGSGKLADPCNPRTFVGTGLDATIQHVVLDGLDGRVARMTRTQSAFGAEFDSLADMVSFGAAPALVMYEWVLRDLGKLGWIAAFVYVAGAALRLARFNTLLEVADKRWFMGLPSPSAAALVAGFVWIVDDLG